MTETVTCETAEPVTEGPITEELVEDIEVLQEDHVALKEEVEFLKEQLAALHDLVEALMELAQESNAMLHAFLQQPQPVGMVTVQAPRNANPWQQALASLPALGDPNGRGTCPTHGETQLNVKARCVQCSNDLTRQLSQQRMPVR